MEITSLWHTSSLLHPPFQPPPSSSTHHHCLNNKQIMTAPRSLYLSQTCTEQRILFKLTTLYPFPWENISYPLIMFNIALKQIISHCYFPSKRLLKIPLRYNPLMHVRNNQIISSVPDFLWKINKNHTQNCYNVSKSCMTVHSSL